MMNLSEGLKRFRNELHITQKEVADNAHISIRNYQDYEYGKVVPTATALIAIANFYDISLDYLVGRSDNPKRNA
ncbi:MULTISPECIES: helix-turn-helix transcriptional regulator [Congzhengia]|jgi:transcriptional regulator with XRE-family HTH domain|uniref:Helix-turn-helix transcriptional regulator n=1 Tax=Congzhengia minquanensis TaxID=2763657 RepID=A0A926HXC7_9FIRM|nr:helix-turn-helix transcriptional regulator [Congzhengia minquanensis]MBC8539929.1 helix-turn-helix transcriptional regulator [Congzhengia minquanensis]MBD8946809.1 XRE family transcriptional regulator [Clostridiales bacterium]HBL82975.1 XRE family transcriptional regulator [Clostridiales bacterium]